MTTEELALTVVEHTGKIERHEGRIKALESETKILHEMSTSVAVLAEQIKAQTEKIDTMATTLKYLQEKPAQRWDTVILAIIKAVIAGIIGYILAKVGLGA